MSILKIKNTDIIDIEVSDVVSPLKIYDGTSVKNIPLVDVADPNASAFRIMTSQGIKALKKTVTVAAFSPLNIPNCALWLDFNDVSSMVMNASNYVSKINNKGSLGGSFDQGSSSYQAVYLPNTVGNKGVLRFSNDRYLGTMSCRSLSDTNYKDTTVFAAIKNTGSTYQEPTVFADTNGLIYERFLLHADSQSGQIISFDVADPYNSRLQTTAVRNQKHLITGRRNTQKMELRINGVEKSTKTPTNSYSITTLPIALGAYGYYVGANNYFMGDMMELIIFSRSLTNEEIVQVENYLINKWNII